MKTVVAILFLGMNVCLAQKAYIPPGTTQTEVPDIIDLPRSDAERKITSSNLNVTFIYVQDEFQDMVVAIEYKGEFVKTGDAIPERETIIVYVGDGCGEVTLEDSLLYYEYMAYANETNQ